MGEPGMDERGNERARDGQAGPWYPPASPLPPGSAPPGLPLPDANGANGANGAHPPSAPPSIGPPAAPGSVVGPGSGPMPVYPGPQYPPASYPPPTYIPPAPPTLPIQPYVPLTPPPPYTLSTNGYAPRPPVAVAPPRASRARPPQRLFVPRVRLWYHDRLRNAVCGIGAAACIGLADALMLPTVVVAAFVAVTGGGNLLVALIPAIAALTWELPGVIAGSAIANRPRVVPLAAVATLVWALLVGVLAFLCATQIAGTARGLLGLFFTLYALAAVAGGVALLAAGRLPVRVATRHERPTLVRGRAYGAAAATVVAALFARGILADGMPGNYLALFALAAVALLAAAGLTLALVERIPTAMGVPRPPLIGLRAAPDLFRLPAYRRYLVFRAFALFATAVEPFYIVYAVRELHATGRFVGSALLALVLARALALGAGRFLARAVGTRLTLQLAALGRTLAATVAIALPAVWDADLFGARFLSDEARGGSFLAVFVCLGAALGFNAAGQSGFLLDILPPVAYPGGIAFTNGLLAVLSLALVAAGIIADRRGIPALFAVAIALGVLSLLAGGLLREPRHDRPPSPERER